MAQRTPKRTGGAFARIHSALCLAPGLFVSKAKAPRPASAANKVLAEQESGDVVFRFEGVAPLGTDDLRILQAVFMLASRPSNRIEINTAEVRSATGMALVAGLGLTISPGEPTIAKMTTGTIAGLAAAGGYAETAGGSRRGVPDALGRLSKILVICLRNTQEVSRAQLLSTADISPGDKELGEPGDTIAIALAPSLSTTLLTTSRGKHARIDQADINGLGQSGADVARARVLHMRLCGFIDPGKMRQAKASVLSEYVFGKTGSADTARRQLQDIRKAIVRLQSLGWGIAGDERKAGRQVFTITRPALR